MTEKYVVKWATETGWAALVAAVVLVGQVLVQTNVEEVVSDPVAWATVVGAAVARVVWAVVRNALLGLLTPK